MEPMALGSPPSSPTSPGVVPNFLPSFLMGDSQPSTPNMNVSPGRSKSNLRVSFSSTPVDARNMRQKLFNQSLNDSHLVQPSYNLQAERSGPPKQSLFDTIENKKVQPVINSTIQSPSEDPALGFNDSYSRIGNESVRYHQAVNNLNNSLNQPYVTNISQVSRNGMDTLWVTVFGFPPSSTSLVLAQLMNCGCIVEKKFPTQGNWVHLKYSSVHEASKALALNGKLVSGNIMVGVVPYYNKEENKENLDNSGITSPIRARSLRHSIVPTQSSNTVIPQNVPQKSTGIVSKAMEYVFGW